MVSDGRLHWDMSSTAELRLRLKRLCFLAVRKNFNVLAAQAAEVLPCDLLVELQPHLTVLQLYHIQASLNSRGVSTLSAWRDILMYATGARSHYGSDSGAQITPHPSQRGFTEEEKTKGQVMSYLFNSILYNTKNEYISSNISSMDTPLFLSTAVRHVDHFTLWNQPEALRSLTTVWSSVLQELERRVHSIRLSHSLDPSKPENLLALLVLHRLLDHGQVSDVKYSGRCSRTLAWILGTGGAQGSGSSACSKGDEGPPSKLPRLDPEPSRGETDQQVLGDCCCDLMLPSVCLRGRLESMELNQIQTDLLRVLCCALPSCSSLRSLTLSSLGSISAASAQDLLGALQQQSRCVGGGLLDLSVSTLPCPSLLQRLLEACPRLRYLRAEVQNHPEFTADPKLPTDPGPPTSQNDHQFPLLTLQISLNQALIPGSLMPSLLRRCPSLCSLSVSGLRLQSEASYGRLMTALSDSCGSLRSLTLDDVNLSDSFEHILLLLERCHFKTLTLKDCRLLEKRSDKEESLKSLSTALVKQKSLRSLSLAQNRIAKHVPALAQLFSPDSSLQSLDLSSNFIQAAELLEFSRQLGALMLNHKPNPRPTLDLRRNPGDRDPDSWSSAISSLASHCELLLDQWKSRNTMADHISNM